jgi:hypothetical protein
MAGLRCHTNGLLKLMEWASQQLFLRMWEFIFDNFLVIVGSLIMFKASPGLARMT